MKKQFFLAMVLLLSSVVTFAQQEEGTFTLQPRAGVNISKLPNQATGGADDKVRIGLAAGLEGEYQLTSKFSLSAGLMYSQQGMKLEAEDEKITMKLDYLNIPILAQYYVSKGFAVKAGIQPGFNLSHKAGGETIKNVNSFDFSIPIGLSYEFPSVPVVIDARYNWGLTDVAKENQGDKIWNEVIQITIGYKFKL